MQRLLDNTFFFVFAVVSSLAAFAYGIFLLLFCPFIDGDILGLGIAAVAVILIVICIDHRRLQRKAAFTYGDH